ncbi:MAG: isopentenyl-diphosphate Delta-isomerase [Proteobacteria bacterium]|nr:isopentenyl-diphosphate Delta-isomerase [Pseudomonadota bacterium]
MEETLILVDEHDNQVGTGEKMEVHRKGILHRCFSIFIFNSADQMLLQKRAISKYHSGGLWTNSCCSHPRNSEELEEAIHRRLIEEMGFDCEMKEIFTFIYKAELDHGLTEHEYDHVYIGRYDDKITPNPEEADGYEWEEVEKIEKEIKRSPDHYTVWFKIAFAELIEKHPGGIPTGF